jgi:hypothetical protein
VRQGDTSYLRKGGIGLVDRLPPPYEEGPSTAGRRATSESDWEREAPAERRERKRDTAGACRPNKGLRTAVLATPAHVLSQTGLSASASTCRFGFSVSRAEAFYHMNYGGIKGHSMRPGAQRRPGRGHG